MSLLTADEVRKKYQLDLFLLRYVKKNPNSYVALWKLIQKFNVLGYTPLYSQIYSFFSASIKKTGTGIELSKALQLASSTAIGKIFPRISLVDTNNHNVQLPTTDKGDKFIFLDFWYSHCAPCIAQFEELKIIYSLFKTRGFEIVSVSTDKISDKQDWTEAITKYQLAWKHFWDIGGTQARKLSINAFPSNFLLDSTGKIILKNIEPPDLNKFLQEKYQ